MNDSYDGFDDPDDDGKKAINSSFKFANSINKIKKKKFFKPIDIDNDIILPADLNINEMRIERFKSLQFNKIIKNVTVNIVQIMLKI